MFRYDMENIYTETCESLWSWRFASKTTPQIIMDTPVLFLGQCWECFDKFWRGTYPSLRKNTN